VCPRKPSSPATIEVVARLSPGAPQTQRCRAHFPNSPNPCKPCHTPATHHHHHSGRPHHSTSCRIALRQIHISRRSKRRESAYSGPIPRHLLLRRNSSSEMQADHHLLHADEGAAPTNRPDRAGTAATQTPHAPRCLQRPLLAGYRPHMMQLGVRHAQIELSWPRSGPRDRA
jgi:hypothetical protein